MEKELFMPASAPNSSQKNSNTTCNNNNNNKNRKLDQSCFRSFLACLKVRNIINVDGEENDIALSSAHIPTIQVTSSKSPEYTSTASKSDIGIYYTVFVYKSSISY